ncbi:MAG: carbamoyl-phosphate-synthetase, partial [Lachnospiraceae bacterium]|nr:carbamoyl-phosphate-synthetase [Lachnospiraceae bacterium]
MKKSKTLLLLGGSAQQVAAIEKAHASGVRTVLIDFLPDNPGRLVADKWYCESSTDIDAVEHIAKIEKADG